jgi:hypothetical protein
LWVRSEGRRFEVKGDRLGYAADCEVTINEEVTVVVANARRSEGQSRVVFSVEEIS